jgi:SSS family solute:Na+ symporter
LTIQIVALAGYSLALMALGLWIGRRVRGASDFFVADRRLGAGLIFSTMLAANIGAGSTVGATSSGYLNGVEAWWWVGSAAIGSVCLFDRPAIRRCRRSCERSATTSSSVTTARFDCDRSAAVVRRDLILSSQLIGLGWIRSRRRRAEAGRLHRWWTSSSSTAAEGCHVSGLVCSRP